MKKEILITGAANGIGRATAMKFAENGWHVWASDIDDKGLEALRPVAGIETIIMDVTSGDSVRKAFEQVSSRQTVLDVVINNAGTDSYFPFSEAPVEEFVTVFEVNVFGVYRVNHVFLPLVRRPGGMIIHTGSESLDLQVPFMPYPLSKKTLESYSKVLRQELKFCGISVVTVRPGAVRTRFLENVARITYPVRDPAVRKAFEKFASQAAGEIGKSVSPESIASLLLKISGIEHPRAVYKINNSLQLKIASKLPFGWVEKMVFRRLSK